MAACTARANEQWLTVDRQRSKRLVGVDSHWSVVHDGTRYLPFGPFHVDLPVELSGIGCAYNDTLRLLAVQDKILSADRRLKLHNQLEEPLIRIGLALLAHVVRRGFTEVQARERSFAAP